MSLRSRLHIISALALAMCYESSEGRISFGKAVFIDPTYHRHKMKRFTEREKMRKRPLTPKQKLSRAKSKRAKQARKRNRLNRSLQLSKFSNHNNQNHKDK